MTSGFRLFILILCGLLAGCNRQVSIEEPAVPERVKTEKGEIPNTLPPLYIGVWAVDADACAVPPGEPGRVVFTDDRFLGYENTCRITSSEEGTEGGWRLAMTCESEGVTVEEIADADVDGDRLILSRNGGEPVEFIRCVEKRGG